MEHSEEAYSSLRQLRRLGRYHSKRVIYGLVGLTVCMGIIILALLFRPTPQNTIREIKEEAENDLIFFYPTVGIPIPGTKYNSTPVSRSDLDQFDNEINELLKPYNDTNCNIDRVGEGQSDGGYLICTNFLNNIEGLVNLGINGYDQLGCNLTHIKSVPNYQFDCTNPTIPLCDNKNG